MRTLLLAVALLSPCLAVAQGSKYTGLDCSLIAVENQVMQIKFVLDLDAEVGEVTVINSEGVTSKYTNLRVLKAPSQLTIVASDELSTIYRISRKTLALERESRLYIPGVVDTTKVHKGQCIKVELPESENLI